MSPKDFLPTDLSRDRLMSAGRLALQSSIAAAGTFAALQALSLPEKFVGVLAAVFVLQPSVGNTFGQATSRVIATLVGSAVGVACLFAMPDGYGTAAALAISVFVMNAIAGLRPDWAYGVIAAVALALRASEDPVQVVQDRAIAIGIGAALGVIVALTIWPDSAKKRARRHLSAALRAIGDSLDNAVRGISGEENDGAAARSRYNSNIETARSEAEGIRWGGRGKMIDEVTCAERLYTSILILNRIAEESDDANNGHDGLADQISTIQVCGCEIAYGLADGDLDHGERLEHISDALQEARRLVSGEADDARLHVLSTAVVFGLGEVADGLNDLVDLMDEKSS